MKLKNKKTGEIVDLYEGLIRDDGKHITIKPVSVLEKCYIYNSLAELNEEWEDYKEPKEYWYIEPNGVIARIDEWDCCTDSDIEIMKTLDNYFETEEEAEKAVEKLKAVKRLKDKGFHFLGWNSTYKGDNADFYIDWIDSDSKNEIVKDLDILFGGE